MYTGFFRLQKKPFQITCDPDFLWMGRKYQEALSALTSGVMQKKGLVVLTGDVGTGKTTLLNRLVEDIKDMAWTARISDPGVGKYDFYRMVAQDLGLPLQIRKRNDFFDLLACFLHDAHAHEKSVVLFIDEAQRLRHDLLEEIREISSLEPPDRKCLTLFLVGQSEFNAALIRPENLSITRQIAISYTLGPLDATETAGY
ncbi:ATP-binding protein, partial [Desulfosarcina sp. OttesenSCG-928-G10]|nr:ATP-binding protein [Desulfosarcina sp. OttesenSCG-928-G10]